MLNPCGVGALVPLAMKEEGSRIGHVSAVPENRASTGAFRSV